MFARATISAVFAVLAAASVATAPASSEAKTKCTNVAACAFFENAGSGTGVVGQSFAGSGVVGMTAAGNGTGYATGAVSGIVLGTNPSGFTAGVFGQGAGTGPGVFGQGYAGVIGYGSAAGVYGVATPAVKSPHVGFGVAGLGRGGVSGSGAALPGVFGFDATGGAPDAYGMEALDLASAGILTQGAVGLIASSTGAAAGTTSIVPTALQLEVAPGVTSEMRALDASGHSVASLDASGDLTLAGALTTRGSPNVATSGADGSTTIAFGTRATRPTIEDVGEAALRNGIAFVPLARDFAATIDARRAYLVFVTPEGDTRGLYVASRTPAGFGVRENGGGRSSVAFEYRIVAEPYDTDDQRLPAANARRRYEPQTFTLHRVTTRPPTPQIAPE